MWNEHFGISVVEMMASGLVTVAHNSGGPRLDIVTPASDGQVTGFLATTPTEYADAMARAFELADEDRASLVQAAHTSVSSRFTDAAFSARFLELFDALAVA